MQTRRSGSGYLLAGLLLVWAGLLFGGFLFGASDATGSERIPTWARMASSLSLVVAAWGWYAHASNSSASPFSLLIAIGMTLGFVGDLFMAELLAVEPHILAGMASFAAGHIAYIAALIYLGKRGGLFTPKLTGGAWLAWIAIGLAGWYLIVYPSSQPATLRWAALGYVLLLASTAGLATGLALQAPVLLPLACGAALFFQSDLILAGELFANYHWPLIGSLVWLTYGPGQMLIVYSNASVPRIIPSVHANLAAGPIAHRTPS
jgi:YhhN family